MAEGGNGLLDIHTSSEESIVDILSEKSTGKSSSSDSEIDAKVPPAPPLPGFGFAGIAAAAAACAAVAEEIRSQDPIDRLLQKQRNDRMFELRKLQHGERPVSNTDSKEKLEKFFSQSSEQTSGSARDPPVRPDSIRVEVSGLLQSRPVSSVIRQDRFRRNLEDVIRGTVMRQERELQTAVRLQSAGLAVRQNSPIVNNDVDGPSHHSDTLSQASFVSSHHSSAEHSGPPSMPSMPQSPWQQIPPWQQSPPWQQQQQAQANWQNMQRPPWQSPPWQQAPWQQAPWQQAPWQQAPWQQAPWQQAPWQQGPWQQQPWQRPPQMQQQGEPPVLPQQPWLTQQSQQQQEASQRSVLAEVQQEHREQIVSEISNLVQRQLVSETLESTFRSQLELTMEGRLSAQGGDGIAVAEAVNSLPSDPNFRRNDFSHLGIQAPTRQQQQSMPAGAMGGYGAWSSPDMNAVMRQMDELQNMVRLSFDLQLDMQRAIRQEVSAALACHHSGEHESNPADAADSTTPTGSRPAREGSCLICLDNSIDTVLYQCGHMCVCLTCGMRLKGMGAHCPMCRAPIRDVIRAFRCQQPE